MQTLSGALAGTSKLYVRLSHLNAGTQSPLHHSHAFLPYPAPCGVLTGTSRRPFKPKGNGAIFTPKPEVVNALRIHGRKNGEPGYATSAGLAAPTLQCGGRLRSNRSMQVLMWLLPETNAAQIRMASLLEAFKNSPLRCQKRHFRYASITAALSQSTGGGATGGWIGGRGGGGGGNDGIGMSPTGYPGQTSDSTSSDREGVIILDVGGMSCGGCSSSVKRILEAQPLVISATVNLATETALVRVSAMDASGAEDGKKVNVGEALADHLTSCGFTSTVRDLGGSDTKSRITPAAVRKREERLKKLKESGQRLTVAWALAAACLFGHAAHWLHQYLPLGLHWLHSAPFHMALSIACLAGPARQLIIDGFTSLKRGTPNMNTLVGLGAISSFSVSSVALMFPKLGWHAFFEEPVMLLAFVLLGRAVEERAKLQATSDMTELLSMIPTRARLILAPSAAAAEDATTTTTSIKGAVKTVEVPTDSLTVGASVLVLPGDRIPVDGIVTSGLTEVDESSLTGEPLPVAKAKGAEVSAGTINCNGTIMVTAQRSGGETVLGDIVRMVEEAQAREAPVQRFADKVSGMFCYGVMGLSAATFVFWNTLGAQWWPAVLPAGGPLLLGIQMACNVMVIACPCALGLATPTAVLVGTAVGARRGLLIRGGDVLERVSELDTVIFDKTGTLTEGRPVITGVVTAGAARGPRSAPGALGVEEVRLLAAAAAVERGTVHPVARAVVRAAEAAGCTPLSVRDGSFQQEPGSGAVAVLEDGTRVAVGTMEWVARHSSSNSSNSSAAAQSFVRRRPADEDEDEVEVLAGESVVYVGVDGALAGTMLMRDAVREGALGTVEALRGMGLRVMMLSGDRKAAADVVGKSVGIPPDMVFADVRPHGKAEFVSALQRDQGRHVAMVGDGVNDSAALAQADVGVAMVGGVGAASEVASIVLMGDRLPQVVDAVELSRATFRKIQQNIAWAFLYNLVGLPVAAGVLLPYNNTMLTPSLCGALMGISSLGVMANSLLLQLEFGRGIHSFKNVWGTTKKGQEGLIGLSSSSLKARPTAATGFYAATSGSHSGMEKAAATVAEAVVVNIEVEEGKPPSKGFTAASSRNKFS